MVWAEIRKCAVLGNAVAGFVYMGRRTQGIKLIVIYIKIQAGANIESCPAYTFAKNRGVFTAPSLSYTFIICA